MALDSRRQVESVDWRKESLASLTAYVVTRHHRYTRQMLETIEYLIEKVVKRHAPSHPELLQLSETFDLLRDDLKPHMLKEEQLLFPYISSLEQASQTGSQCDAPFFGTVRNPVRKMMVEHEAAGELLEQIRALTREYAVPSDGCTSFESLYQSLRELEKDLREHIHLENNHLFPRAIALEALVLPDLKSSSGKHQCFGE